MNRDGERGAGSLLAVASLIVVAVVVSAACCLGLLLAAQHRLRGVADVAALAAARAEARGEPGCPVAEKLVQRSGARMIACRVRGATPEFAVTVEVEGPWHGRWPGVPRQLRAHAFAGPR